jgi:phage gp37-like protein
VYTISEVEDAIIERIGSQVTYLKTCDSLASYLLDTAEDLTIRFPATYAVYGPGRYSHAVSGVQDREMEFSVIVMAKNLRGDRAARHGKGSEKGVYEMLEDVRAALTNQACGLDIDPLLPIDEEPLEGSEEMAAYAIRFRTRCRTTL